MHHFASARAASHPGHAKPRMRSEPYSLFKQPRSSRSRGAFCARGLHLCFTHPESRGGRSAEKRSGAAAPVGHAITRHARRLARRLASHDAGRSPLGAPPWRFWAPGAALASPAFAPDRLQRAPRTQVLVPGGRSPCLPGRTVTSRRRRTPRLAPHSGSSREHALNERGCLRSSIGTIRSQARSCDVVKKYRPQNTQLSLPGLTSPGLTRGPIHPLRKKSLRKTMDHPKSGLPEFVTFSAALEKQRFFSLNFLARLML
jgi:hypothetical protein